MSGAQSGTGNTGSASKADHLDVVLGRFQSWTKAQPGKPLTPGMLPGEAREVSYDEALRASRHRRPAATIRAPESAALKSSMQGPPAASPAKIEKIEKSGRRQPVVASPTPILAIPGLDESKALKAPCPRNAAGIDSSPKIKKSIGSAGAGRSPAFRDVLKGTAELTAGARKGATGLERGRPTSLTLRVSDSEQARIQACAAQANLSVSAYLRQCALGVDELRGQVETALLKFNEQPVRAADLPGLSAIPGILRRFTKKCLQGSRLRRDDRTTLSIR